MRIEDFRQFHRRDIRESVLGIFFDIPDEMAAGSDGSRAVHEVDRNGGEGHIFGNKDECQLR